MSLDDVNRPATDVGSLDMDPGAFSDKRVAYVEAGIQQVVAAPWRRELNESMAQLAEQAIG